MSKTKVLVFDDELSEIGKVYIGLLERNFAVEVTMDPTEITPRFKRMDPELVIVNNDVPGVDPTEICHLVKQESKVPIILLLQKDSATTLNIDSCSADAILYKPVDIKELVDKINELRAVNG